MSRALNFENVVKGFRSRHARRVLDGFTWTLKPGRTGVLLGPSGSGKSTLLRLAAGLERLDGGRVLLGDQLVSSTQASLPPERRRVGFVFQDLELWPHLSVADHVAFGLAGRPRGRAARRDARVTSWAERLGIGALLGVRPPRLSGGERQRVALARALAPEPDVLLLDEPLGSLDPTRRRELVALLAELLGSREATALYVTHDPEEALALGDEVGVLADGRLAESGPPATVYAAPRTDVGARALGPANLLAARRDADRWHTALGELAAREGDEAGADLVLLRPESLRVGDAGVRAVVAAVWPTSQGLRARVRLGEQVLEACADRPVGVGEEVGLLALGPVSGVRRAGPVMEAA